MRFSLLVLCVCIPSDQVGQLGDVGYETLCGVFGPGGESPDAENEEAID